MTFPLPITPHINYKVKVNGRLIAQGNEQTVREEIKQEFADDKWLSDVIGRGPLPMREGSWTLGQKEEFHFQISIY